MTRALAVLRPEPGNAATAARIEALGLVALRLPLFAVRPIAWTPPAAGFDALLVTSANAMRHGGAGLAALRGLPVIAVGAASAAAARAAGFAVAATGEGDAAAAAALAGGRGLLHLAGADRVAVPGVAAVTVYAAEAVDADPRALAGGVALCHSARAARRLGVLVDAAGVPRGAIRVAALSDAVAHSAGAGWRDVAVAAMPTDAALIARAAGLARDQPD